MWFWLDGIESWCVGVEGSSQSICVRRFSPDQLSPFFASIFPLFPQKRLILRLSPFLYSHRWKRGWSWPWALTFCMEDPETPGKIQMERFIPVESFRKKSNTFRGITFSPFLPKRPKFSVPFVWITSARLHVERKWKIYRYFVNVTTQSFSCFSAKNNTSAIWWQFFTKFPCKWQALPVLIQPVLLCYANRVVFML